MIEQKEQLIEDLGFVAETYKEQKYLKNFLNTDFNDYLEYKEDEFLPEPHSPNKPWLRCSDEIIKKPEKPKKQLLYNDEYPRLTGIGLFLMFMFLIWLIMGLFMKVKINTTIIIMTCVLLILGLIPLTIAHILGDKKKEEEYKENVKGYKEAIKNRETLKEIDAIEQEKYKKELEEYEKSLSVVKEKNKETKKRLKEEYDKEIKSCKEKLQQLTTEQVINKMNNILHEDYFQYAYELKTIIQHGRADTLKEALNVLKNDLFNQDLLDEQQRKNDILEYDLEERRNADEEHQRKLERIAEEQARESAEIERDRVREMERHNRITEENERKTSEDIKKQTYTLAVCGGCRKAKHCYHFGHPHYDCPDR